MRNMKWFMTLGVLAFGFSWGYVRLLVGEVAMEPLDANELAVFLVAVELTCDPIRDLLPRVEHRGLSDELAHEEALGTVGNLIFRKVGRVLGQVGVDGLQQLDQAFLFEGTDAKRAAEADTRLPP